MGPTMSADLIREQLSKRNLKEPTAAVGQASNSRANALSGSKNKSKITSKIKLVSGLKRPVEMSTQTMPDRRVNGHSQNPKRPMIVSHQNSGARVSSDAQVHEKTSSSVPKIDESLISDEDEGLPLISAVYSLAASENGSQVADGSTGKPGTAKVASQVSGTPLVSLEKVNNNKRESTNDITTPTFKPIPGKTSQSPSLVSSGKNGLSQPREAVPIAVPGGISQRDIGFVEKSTNCVVPGASSRQLSSVTRVEASLASSVPSNATSITRNAVSLLSVPPQPTVTVSPPRGTGTGYNLRQSNATSLPASSATGPRARATSTTVSAKSATTSKSTALSYIAPPSSAVSQVRISPKSLSLSTTGTAQLMKANAGTSVSTPQTNISLAAASPVLISPKEQPAVVGRDSAGRLVTIPISQKPCAMTSLVQLVNSGASSVTSTTTVPLKPQVITTKAAGLPLIVPAPQKQVLYKFSGPLSVSAGAGTPRALPSQPVVFTGSPTHSSPQSQTLFQIMTPDGPMYLVPVSKSSASPTRLVPIPVKANTVAAPAAPAPVQIVKAAPSTARVSVSIAPHPGISTTTHPVILSASSSGSQNMASHASGLVSGGAKLVQRVAATTTAAGTTVTVNSTATTSATSVRSSPIVTEQANVTRTKPSSVTSTVYSRGNSDSEGRSKESAASPKTPVNASSSEPMPSVSVGPSPQEARIQRLKELLQQQEQALDRLRNKRQREMENARETTIIGRSNADAESTVEIKGGNQPVSDPFVLPLPPKKMKPDFPHSKGGGKVELGKKKAEGFLPNGEDTKFVQLVGLEKIVEKLKNKKQEEAAAKARDSCAADASVAGSGAVQ